MRVDNLQISPHGAIPIPFEKMSFARAAEQVKSLPPVQIDRGIVVVIHDKKRDRYSFHEIAIEVQRPRRYAECRANFDAAARILRVELTAKKGFVDAKPAIYVEASLDDKSEFGKGTVATGVLKDANSAATLLLQLPPSNRINS